MEDESGKVGKTHGSARAASRGRGQRALKGAGEIHLERCESYEETIERGITIYANSYPRRGGKGDSTGSKGRWGSDDVQVKLLLGNDIKCWIKDGTQT